jgi:VWFA-related protein
MVSFRMGRLCAARLVRFLLVSTAVASLLLAQEAQPSGQVFRSSARLVVVDVVVTDADGRPARNAQQADFTLLEDGTPQTIVSFESPESHPSALEKPSQETNARLISQGANATTAAALNIIVLDELNSEIADQAYARTAIRKFLQKHGPRLEQPTSLMILGQDRLELLHDYTQDANALSQSLDHRHAELPFGLLHAEFSGAGERLSKTLWALQQIAVANNQFAGRKNVIWVGPGFPALNPTASLIPKDRERLIKTISEDADLLLDARVAVYTVDPRGLPVVPITYGTLLSETSGELLFESIAPETGGEIMRLRNDVDVAISSSAARGATYYTLAYYPTNRTWDGKFRNIEVKVRGHGLHALARKGYFGFPEGPLTDEQIDTVLSRAVMNPLTYRSLEVRATFIPAGYRAGKLNIKVDRPGLDWRQVANGKHRCEVTAVTAIVGSGNRVVTHKVRELEVLVDDKHFDSQWDKPVTFTVPTPLPSDTRHIKVVVQDAKNGRIGTTDIPRESLPLR